MSNSTDIRITTEDGVELTTGNRAFNYYDHKPGVIERINPHAQPDTSKGQDSSTPMDEWTNHWFTFRHDDGTSTSLDGSRICSVAYARKRGWIEWVLCIRCNKPLDPSRDPAVTTLGPRCAACWSGR